jgi:hypothetical protein
MSLAEGLAEPGEHLMQSHPRHRSILARALVVAAIMPFAACAIDDDLAEDTEPAAVRAAPTATAAPALAAGSRNLARDPGVVATAQSTFSGYSPARTIDGDTNTTVGPAYGWANAHGGGQSLPQWLEVDLGQPRLVEAVTLYTAASYEIQHYDITAWDGAAWRTLVEQRGNRAVVVNHPVTPLMASKIRVIGRRGPEAQTIYVRVNELQIIGQDAEPPPVSEVIDEGNGWQVVHVTAPAGAGPAVDEVIAVVQGGADLTGVPLPQSLKDDLALDPPDQVVVVSDWVARDIATAEATGVMPPRLAAIAEPDDGGSEQSLLARCSDQMVTRARSVSFNRPFTQNLGNDGAFTGTLSLTGSFSVSATGEARFAKKRFKLWRWCIPYGARFEGASLTGQATVDQGATLEGTVRYAKDFDFGEIAKPDLGGVWFAVGPVPVYLSFSLPVTAGLRLAASASSSVRYNGSQAGVASFQVSCSGSCSGSGSWSATRQPGQPLLNADLSARIRPTPWLDVSLRVGLYHEWVAFVQGGARAELAADLWGYVGNNCGDADATGGNEQVAALTADLDGTLVIVGGVGALGGDPSTRDLWSHTWHLLWHDLLGNPSARQPLLTGPATTSVGASTGYGVAMRPCWPYDDTVTYELAPAGGAVQTLTGSPRSATTGQVSWSSAGSKALTARAVSDRHGRRLDASTARTVTVQGAVQRNLARDPGVTASAQSTFSGYSAARTIDGDTNTTVGGAYGWANAHGSGQSLPQWMQVTFTAPRVVEAINLYTAAGYEIQNYDLQAWNGASWVTLVQQRSNRAVTRSHPVTPVTATAIRVLGLRGPEVQTIYVRVNELQILGRDP